MTIIRIDSMKQEQQHYFNGDHEDSGNKILLNNNLILDKNVGNFNYVIFVRNQFKDSVSKYKSES